VGVPVSARVRSRPGLRSRRSLAAALAFACCGLTGCAADFNAQTNQQYQPGVGTDDRSNQVFVLNCLVIADSNGDGTLVGTLINQATADDELISVEPAGATANDLTISTLAKPIPLDSQAAVKLQTGGAIRLSGAGVVLGNYITVTFSFEQAAPIEEQIPIVPAGDPTTGVYSGIPVGPTTSPGASPTDSSAPSSGG
jgi:hypothetical protein